jgi:hypothetical protein
MRRILALGLVTLAVVAMPVASPAFACDCGGIAPPPNGTVSIAAERAIVSLKDGIQTTDLLLDVTSTSTESGLIVPTPTPATVSSGALSDFDEVERAILPRPSYEEDWWGVDTIVSAVRDARMTIPVVSQHVKLGPIEATTLSASDTAGLQSWLVANNFVLPNGAAELLRPYVTAGWSFVAIKLSADGALSGTLDPVRLTFETSELVYPARLYQGYTEPHSVRLYVIDDNRVDVVRSAEPDAEPDAARKPINAAQKVVWAARLLAGEPQTGRFLTVFDIRFDSPATQASSDLYFARSKANDEVISSAVVVKTMTLLGVPFGTVLVGSAVLALLALTSFFIWRMRVR